MRRSPQAALALVGVAVAVTIGLQVSGRIDRERADSRFADDCARRTSATFMPRGNGHGLVCFYRDPQGDLHKIEAP